MHASEWNRVKLYPFHSTWLGHNGRALSINTRPVIMFGLAFPLEQRVRPRTACNQPLANDVMVIAFQFVVVQTRIVEQGE